MSNDNVLSRKRNHPSAPAEVISVGSRTLNNDRKEPSVKRVCIDDTDSHSHSQCHIHSQRDDVDATSSSQRTQQQLQSPACMTEIDTTIFQYHPNDKFDFSYFDRLIESCGLSHARRTHHHRDSDSDSEPHTQLQLQLQSQLQSQQGSMFLGSRFIPVQSQGMSIAAVQTLCALGRNAEICGMYNILPPDSDTAHLTEAESMFIPRPMLTYHYDTGMGPASISRHEHDALLVLGQPDMTCSWARNSAISDDVVVEETTPATDVFMIGRLLQVLHWTESHSCSFPNAVVVPELLLSLSLYDEQYNSSGDSGSLLGVGRAAFVAHIIHKLSTQHVRTADTVWSLTSPEALLGSTSWKPSMGIWSIGVLLWMRSPKCFAFQNFDTEYALLMQLFVLFGTPTEQSWRGVTNLPYFSLEFPKWLSEMSDCSASRFDSCDNAACDLLSSMIAMNPADRPSASECLAHAFFDPVRGCLGSLDAFDNIMLDVLYKQQVKCPPTVLNDEKFLTKIADQCKPLVAAARVGMHSWLETNRMAYRLSLNCMHVAFQLFDRVSLTFPSHPHDAHLLSLACICIGAKLCNESPSGIWTGLEATDEKRLRQAECAILQSYRYKIPAVTSLHFLEIWCHALPLSTKQMQFARDLCTASIAAPFWSLFPPSTIAASCVCVAAMKKPTASIPDSIRSCGIIRQEDMSEACIVALFTALDWIPMNSSSVATAEAAEATEAAAVAAGTVSLVTLSNDALLCIIQMLPFHARFNLACCCSSLRDVCYSRYTHLWSTPVKLASYCTTVNGDVLRRLAQTLPPQLQSLSLRQCHLPVQAVQDALNECGQQLESLDLSHMIAIQADDEKTPKRNLILPHTLKVLLLRGSDFMTHGTLMQVLESSPIQTLDVGLNPSLQADMLRDMLETKAFRSTLCDLNVQECADVDDNWLQQLSSTCGTQLHSLHLDMCLQVTDAGMILLARACPNFVKLGLSATQVSDMSLRALGTHCSNLRALSLAFCEDITTNGLQHIAQACNQLDYLNLCMVQQIDDDPLVTIASFGMLKYLNLRGCVLVTDVTLQALADNCHRLEHLHLLDCVGVTAAGATIVRNACPESTVIF
jgi:F-box domain